MNNMDRGLLRRVQLQLLEIACEVKRVCEDNNIMYWLDSGSCLGAVRHGGFIPWDDDMDIGMLRDDYERFRRIANDCLGREFYFQDWHTHASYPLPYGKVRMRGTKYIESKSNMDGENGFFVDIFPFDKWTPEKSKMIRRLASLQRILLLKNGYRPWNDNNKISVLKWMGYLPYRLLAKTGSRTDYVNKYESMVFSIAKDTGFVYEQLGWKKIYLYKKEKLLNQTDIEFEGIHFKIPADYDYYLMSCFGDYMTPPPVEARYNRHQIAEVDFGDK